MLCCAALAGCSGKKADAADFVASASPSPAATESDPYAFSVVAYREYSDAARQTGILPDLVAREYGFSDGVAALCRSTATDLTALLGTLKTAAAGDDNAGYALQARIDEVSLRIDMACSQRMSDWIAAGGGSANPGDEGYAAESEAGTGDDEAGIGEAGIGEAGIGEAGEPTEATSGPSSAPSSGPSSPPSSASSAEVSEEAPESNFGQASISDLSAADISDSGGDAQEYDLGDDDAPGSGMSDPPSDPAPAAGAPTP